MASKAITIKDYKDAIDKSVIPGTFAAGRTEFNFALVESINSRKKKITWQLRLRLLNKQGHAVEIKESYLTKSGTQLPDDWKAELTVDSKQEGGKIKETVPTYVTSGKNIGKKNATNIVTQALRDALSLYNKQYKKSHPEGKESKSGDVANAKLSPPPMTLKKINSAKAATLGDDDFTSGITVQRKYNGVRVIAYYDWIKKEVIFYSRSGHEYPGMDHIRRELHDLLLDPPSVELLTGDCAVKSRKVYCEESRLSPEEAKRSGDREILYLDGEFYLHGKPLEYISGQSRNTEGEARLEYHVYDCFFPTAIAAGDDMLSKCRQQYLQLVFKQLKSAHHVIKVEDYKVKDNKEIMTLRDRFIKEGYEGAVARKDLGIYQYSYNNYHSSMILKVKKIHDDEFELIGFTEGSKGKDKGALIWMAEVDEKRAKDKNDRAFTVVPKSMTLKERKQMFACLSEKVEKDGKTMTRFERDFLGKPLTVEYAELSTKTGKPLQPKAITVRTYEEPETDPMKKAFEKCKVSAGGEVTDVTEFIVEQLDTV